MTMAVMDDRAPQSPPPCRTEHRLTSRTPPCVPSPPSLASAGSAAGAHAAYPHTGRRTAVRRRLHHCRQRAPGRARARCAPHRSRRTPPQRTPAVRTAASPSPRSRCAAQSRRSRACCLSRTRLSPLAPPWQPRPRGAAWSPAPRCRACSQRTTRAAVPAAPRTPPSRSRPPAHAAGSWQAPWRTRPAAPSHCLPPPTPHVAARSRPAHSRHTAARGGVLSAAVAPVAAAGLRLNRDRRRWRRPEGAALALTAATASR